jgi:predicted MFS family arabinose efflux permease
VDANALALPALPVTTLGWLFVLSALVSLDGRAITVMLPAIADTFGVRPGEAGWGVTSYTFAYGALQLAYGPLSDRYGRLPVVRAATVLFVTGVALSAAVGSLPGFIGARFVTGAFAAAMVPTTFAYIGDTVPYTRRQTVIGQFGASLAIAQVLALTVAGVVTWAVSWRVMFAGVATLAALPIILIRSERAATASHDLASEPLSYRAILRRPTARRVYVAVLIEGVFALGGTTYLAVIAKDRFGMNDLQAGLLLGALGLGAATGSLSLRRLAPRFGERWLSHTGGAVQLVCWCLLPLPEARFVAPLTFAGVGLGWVWLHSTLQTRATELVPEARGKAIALFALALFLGGAVGTAVLGRLIDAGLIGTQGVVCGVGLGLVGVYVGLRPLNYRGG